MNSGANERKREPQKYILIPISTVGERQTFGEVEVIRDIPRQTYAITTSNAVIFQVDAMRFRTLLVNYSYLDDDFQEKVRLKEQLLQSQIENHDE